MPTLNTLRASLTVALDNVDRMVDERQPHRTIGRMSAVIEADRALAVAHRDAASAAFDLASELTKRGNQQAATQTLILYGYHDRLATVTQEYADARAAKLDAVGGAL